MNLSDSKKKLALAGALCGLVAACLAFFGNPANMAFCIACFIRDTAGALGMHQAEAVMYVRPEIIGLVLGAFIISIVTKEYRSTAGSAPMIRFILGMIIMIGSLVFLGCPLRMVIRMSAGDLNAWVALIGFVLGVATGVIALKKGFSLGRAYVTKAASGAVLPVITVGIFILLTATDLLKASESGPGSMHAPIVASMIGGLLFGALAQKSRMCFAGGIRDVILMKNFDLLTVVGSLLVVMLLYNVMTGGFVLGFDTPRVMPFRTFVEYSRNVCSWVCSSSGGRMSSAAADPGRSGVVRFGSNCHGNVCRRSPLPQSGTGIQWNITESGDKRAGGRRSNNKW